MTPKQLRQWVLLWCPGHIRRKISNMSDAQIIAGINNLLTGIGCDHLGKDVVKRTRMYN